MNSTRRRPAYLKISSLLLATAVGAASSRAVASDPDPTQPALGVPGQGILPSPPAAGPGDEPKVHGTITVDFDKVTISELLKLVAAVEKVDGKIHIVSAKPRDGESVIVVGGQQKTITLSKPDGAAPQLILGPASPPESTTVRMPQTPLPFLPKIQELPRLAALGRLLGLSRKPEPWATEVPTGRPDVQRSPNPKVIPLETTGPEPLASSSPVTPEVANLPIPPIDGGTFLGSLASGEAKVVGPIHSPWPARDEKAPASVALRDAEVARAGHQASREVPSSPQRHVTVQGESFEAVSRKYYGDSRYAWALWWANRERVAWPDALAEGKSIMIPGLGQLEPRMVMAKVAQERGEIPPLEHVGPRRDPEMVRASATSEAPGSAESTSPGGLAVHVVRPEDTLRIIAREKCGDERKALEIMALNRDALSREGRPRVGQCLILPASAARP